MCCEILGLYYYTYYVMKQSNNVCIAIYVLATLMLGNTALLRKTGYILLQHIVFRNTALCSVYNTINTTLALANKTLYCEYIRNTI